MESSTDLLQHKKKGYRSKLSSFGSEQNTDFSKKKKNEPKDTKLLFHYFATIETLTTLRNFENTKINEKNFFPHFSGTNNRN